MRHGFALFISTVSGAIAVGCFALAVGAFSGAVGCGNNEPPPPPPKRDPTTKTTLFSDRPANLAAKATVGASSLPTQTMLALRLQALSTRVQSMHDAWKANHGESHAELDALRVDLALAPIIKRIEEHATVSLHVRDLASQAVLYDHQGQTLRNPASNQKMLTASAALDLLGPDYQFQTHFYQQGKNLYVVGEGDPTLTSERLVDMMKEVAAQFDFKGVEKLRVDDTAFSIEKHIPGYQDDEMGAAYTAPTGALSLDDNAVAFTLIPRGAGEPLTVKLEHPNRNVHVDCTATGSATDDAPENTLSVKSVGDGAITVIEVRGSLSVSRGPQWMRRRVEDPGIFAGEAFAAALAQTLNAPPLAVERGAKPEGAHLLFSWSSAPLIEVVKNAMAHSNNFATEQVLRTLAWRMTSEPGGWENGTKVLAAYWQTIGVNPDALVIKNGSGLSNEGRFTAAGIADLLSAAAMTQVPNSGLLSVLPEAGKEGTLHSRHNEAKGRLRAKTGTMDNISALSGVLTSVAGDPVLVFSLMLNPTKSGGMAVGDRHAAEIQIIKCLITFIDSAKTKAKAAAKHGRRGK